MAANLGDGRAGLKGNTRCALMSSELGKIPVGMVMIAICKQYSFAESQSFSGDNLIQMHEAQALVMLYCTSAFMWRGCGIP